jgi:hypothetical protein
MPEIAKCNIATTKLLGISTRASDFQESLLSGKNIKTCKINFDYKAKLTGNRLSTPFFIDSKYSSGAESGPTAETSSHLTVSSSEESRANLVSLDPQRLSGPNIRLVWHTPANQVTAWVLNANLQVIGSSPVYGPYFGYSFQ